MKSPALFTLIIVLLTAAGCNTTGRPSDDAGESTLPATSTTAPLPQAGPTIHLEDRGLAPEIANDTWINSNPLTLASQRGKVVLLAFWTFGCINCQRVIPYLRQWHEDFAGDDFQVISIHYPEFPREREFDQVAEATERFEIRYPVALDNDGRTWRAYNQRYWPTMYLIDKAGHIRYKHIGEFNEQTAAMAAAAIELLLAE